MDTNMFGKVYDIIWSLFAIVGGLVLIFRRDWFISVNSRAFMKLYKKTNFTLFKIQSEEITAPYMYILVVIIGIVAMVIGANTLLGLVKLSLF